MTVYKTETIVREFEDERMISETTTTTIKNPQADKTSNPVGFTSALRTQVEPE